MLVWDDHFGADVPELRMRLPELYPTPVVPDDEYEDVSSSALEAAVVSYRLRVKRGGSLRTHNSRARWSVLFFRVALEKAPYVPRKKEKKCT